MTGEPIRLVVTGKAGQVARALQESGSLAGFAVIAIGRPEVDFLAPDSIAPALRAARPQVIVNAAAYTAVDKAEQEEAMATAVNGTAAGAVAKAAAELGVPVIHLSTDYVFDGKAARPYREDDAVAPIGAYGRSKLAGEDAVRASTADHVILRTAWVYSPFGANFVKTMLRLGETRSEVGVVADQHGNPTSALDIAEAVFGVARTLIESDASRYRGTFHLAGQGEAVWADLAEAVFETAEKAGRAPVQVRRITTADYPTPAARPANSRLDCTALASVYGIQLPPWRASAAQCVLRLLEPNGEASR